nr:MAG TPA: hypothetical protein [Caudoviricetes sp.]
MGHDERRGAVMQYTEHYGFKKPDYEDFADIKDINYALDQLDGKFYEQESKIDKAVAITGDLAAVEQTVKEMKTQLGTFAQQIKKNTNNLNTTISDVAKLTFQLQLKDLVDSSDMTHVAVDQIDSTDSAVIISGTYADKKVYI